MDKDVRKRLAQGAQIVADEAKRIAGEWSTKIPAATRVVSDSKGVAVVTDGKAAPSARPNEFGLRHPTFGNRERWYSTPFRPYLAKARDNKIDEVQQAALGVYDDWKREAGYH